MNHFLITSLPRLPELGGVPPLSPAELLAKVSGTRRADGAIRLLFLGVDLLWRDASLAGARPSYHPAVLSLAQLRGEAPLPSHWFAGGPSNQDSEALWAQYYRQLASQAQRLPSPFLGGWARHEVGLRTALAKTRAHLFNLEFSSPVAELAEQMTNLAPLVAEWAAAPNALAGLRVLDAARWRWISAHEPYFSFDDDELVAYAARLCLLQRWSQLSGSEAAPAQSPQPPGARA